MHFKYWQFCPQRDWNKASWTGTWKVRKPHRVWVCLRYKCIISLLLFLSSSLPPQLCLSWQGGPQDRCSLPLGPCSAACCAQWGSQDWPEGSSDKQKVTGKTFLHPEKHRNEKLSPETWFCSQITFILKVWLKGCLHSTLPNHITVCQGTWYMSISRGKKEE